MVVSPHPVDEAHLPRETPSLAALERIEERVLWLAVRMVDYANRGDAGGIKYGGHQASSASMVSIMTALWFSFLEAADKVAVKPHASPVLHAINYLIGHLDGSYLTQLRQKGGLQAYPSRTKDPDVADFSTGSVGLGAVAPLFAAAVRRFVGAHFSQSDDARFISLVGDAELDEGNVWEAIAEPALHGLGNVMMVVDVNRQSLDRVVPGVRIRRLEELFRDSGWHVVEAKYGHRLQDVFDREGGGRLRHYIDSMSNEQYQAAYVSELDRFRDLFLTGADSAVRRFVGEIPDEELQCLVRDLGGHDVSILLDRYRACDEVPDQPSVVFAYTVKGWRLPFAGDPLNHSSFLSADQIDHLRTDFGLTQDSEWNGFDSSTDEGRLCVAVGEHLTRPPQQAGRILGIPESLQKRSTKLAATQQSFGRLLAALGEHPEVASRVVTVSPDVAISTNLGAWINARGIFSPDSLPDFFGDARALRWHQGPRGHHIELGISEMNLFLMLGQLGLSGEHHGEPLLPIGTVYDPFVLRGLDAFIYSIYNGARFIVVGTPSGISLSPEGGAHQSTITPSIGLEMPGVTFYEPTYARALDWILCHGLEQLWAEDGQSAYLRLSTRPIDQTPFQDAAERLGVDTLRRAVLRGGYRLREPSAGVRVLLVASGPVMPEVLRAADILADEGVGATVLDITSLDRLYRSWRLPLREASQSGVVPHRSSAFDSLIHPHERTAPVVTIHDAATHAMAWLGSVFGQLVVPVGVDTFGESGSVEELYRAHGLLPGQIVNAALIGLEESRAPERYTDHSA